MKSNILHSHHLWIFSLLMLSVLILFTPSLPLASSKSADTTGTVTEEAKDTVEAVMNYTAEQKEAAMKKAQSMLDEIDSKLKTWEEKSAKKWGESKDAAKDAYANSKTALQEQRKELSQWYEKMKGSSSDAWSEVQKGFSDSYKNLTESFNKAQEEI